MQLISHVSFQLDSSKYFLRAEAAAEGKKVSKSCRVFSSIKKGFDTVKKKTIIGWESTLSVTLTVRKFTIGRYIHENDTVASEIEVRRNVATLPTDFGMAECTDLVVTDCWLSGAS